MNEITKVVLENEMDLILAHKQSMRIAELAGLSLAAQTTFATAVSEVSRSAIGKENEASLTLFVSDKREKLKYITAVLVDRRKGFSEAKDEGFKYAKRLVPFINVDITPAGNRIELNYRLPLALRIDDSIVEKWRINMNTDPAVSPYEEIKRKNRQLIEMADKLRESEQQYKALTDSLPIMIFSMTPGGDIIYANKWLHDYTGESIGDLNSTKWENTLHPGDFGAAWKNWHENSSDNDAHIVRERRLKDASTGEYRWHKAVSIPIKDDGDSTIKHWNTFMVDIHAQKMIEETLQDNMQLKVIRAELEEKVALLNQSNQQLEQFAYITSHDLQEPLRKISFYSDFLMQKYGSSIPKEAAVFFDNLINATERMKILIQDVLAYSTVRKDTFTRVDLAEIAEDALKDLEISINEKEAEITIDKLPVIDANARQLKQLFENLISNSLKFSTPGLKPVISISAQEQDGKILLSFRDNGIGFEEKYISRMFDLFQRLHTRDKYTGTGIGLAICRKIVNMHNGHITASGKPGKGAVFIVELPITQGATLND